MVQISFHSNPRYAKNCSSTCNTPKKLTVHLPEKTTTTPMTAKASTSNMTNTSFDKAGYENKSISRDLFSVNDITTLNESSKSMKPKTLTNRMNDLMLSPLTNDNDSMETKSPFDCSIFTHDSKITPTTITVRRMSNMDGTASCSTPIKSVSAILTSTPTSNHHRNTVNSPSYFANRTANTNSRNSSSTRSPNDSRSYSHDKSSIISHEKTKERSGSNVSPLCFGDFFTPTTSKQHSQKARKSFNSFENASKDCDFPNFTPKGKPNRISLTPSTPSQQTDISIAVNSNKSTTIPTVKPMKRVVPTRIVGSHNEFNCPAFRSDNNILELPHEENNDSPRDILKSQKDIIQRVFQEEQPPETNLRVLLQEKLGDPTKAAQAKKFVPPIDLSRITNKLMLHKFIDIYSIVLDLNLITNILTEFSYLVNLINVDVEEYYERNPHMLSTANNINDRNNAIESTLSEINVVDITKQMEPNQSNESEQQQHKKEKDEAQPLGQRTKVSDCNMALNELNTCVNANTTINAVDINAAAASLLKNINNCVYFGLGVLQLQKYILRLLDITSIKVLLENERLTTLDTTIKDDLMNVYTHKIQMDLSLHNHDVSSGGHRSKPATLQIQNSSMKVFYQQEQDTQINFPTSREFAIFKKQRDTFYAILG